MRLPRPKFCSLLSRFWTRFARSWDVLLHGNPAADIFGGLKLSSGGELGMGVGEEEWGSGERDVLEDLAKRTDGLIDMVVSRFGEPAPTTENITTSSTAAKTSVLHEELPWLGAGNYPEASDGVIFAGINAATRPSLRNISQWVQQVYTYGEHAYGVRDNPHRERRKRRRRSPPEPEADSDSVSLAKPASTVSARDWDPQRQRRPRPERAADSKGSAISKASASSKTSGSVTSHRPGIPPPILSAVVEQSLDKATQKAESDAERSQQSEQDSGTTLGIPDQYMKYLTFGLSTLAKSSSTSQSTSQAKEQPSEERRGSTSSSITIRASDTKGTNESGKAATTTKARKPTDDNVSSTVPTLLAQVDPIPDGEPRQARIARQKYLEEKGYFIVGLTGDLDPPQQQGDSSTAEANADEENEDVDADDDDDTSGDHRTLVRTLHIEVARPLKSSPSYPDTRNPAPESGVIEGLEALNLERKPSDPAAFWRARVVVYIRRPFIYCFIFKDRTPSLQMARFYRTLHATLKPIHKPLVASTSVERVMRRIAEVQASGSGSVTADNASGGSENKKSSDPNSLTANPIYDLLYDPRRLTLHTSIPNIPEPGTPAAEGLGSSSGGRHSRLSAAATWTRLDALNVHSQILATLASSGPLPGQRSGAHRADDRRSLVERTAKTARGWWVVWLKLPPSEGPASGENEADAGRSEPHQPPSTSAAGGLGVSSDGTLRSTSTFTTNSTLPGPPSTTATAAKLPPSLDRVAFLVRRAAESASSASGSHGGSGAATPSSSSDVASGMAATGSRAVASMWSVLSLRSGALSDRSTGGAAAGWGPPVAAGAGSAGGGDGAAAAAGLVGGIGVDSRRYVEGLLGLNR